MSGDGRGAEAARPRRRHRWRQARGTADRDPRGGAVRAAPRQDRAWASSATDPIRSWPSSTRRRPARNVREWLGDAPRFDVPIVATLDEALAVGRATATATALLIGIAPTGGKLPAGVARHDPRGDRAGLDILSGLHTMIGDDPEFAAAAAAAGVEIVDYRRPPEREETSVGRLHGPGKKVILTVGTDCAIGKMSVALELTRAATEQGLRGRVRADRPDRDDDRGLGRGGRPGHQRLLERHVRVAHRAGRGARRLGHRRGPGLARPPGLQRRDPRPHPRLHATGHGHGPQAGPGRPRLRPRATAPTSRSSRCPEFIRLHEAGGGPRRPVEGRRDRPQHVALPGRRRCAADRRRDRGADRACRATTRSASGRTGCGRRSSPRSRRSSREARRSPAGPLAPRRRTRSSSRTATRSGSPGRTAATA